MFEKIRKPRLAKNIFAYITLGFICIVFVFLGVPSDQLFTGGGYVAIVNKEVISIVQFQQALEQMNQGKDPSKKPSAERQKEEKKQIINSLIDEELIFQSALDVGLYVSDEELRKTITELPAFQKNGKFNNSAYRAFLQYQRTSAEKFENQIRKWILTTRVKKTFDQSFVVSELEKERNTDLDQYEFKFKYVRIPLTNEKSSEEINMWQSLLQNSEKIDEELVKRDLVWVDSSPVTLRNLEDSIAGFEEYDSLFEQVISLYPDSGVIPKLYMASGGSLLLMKLDGVEVKKSEKKYSDWMQNILAFSISKIIFSSWKQNLKEKSRILVNKKYI